MLRTPAHCSSSSCTVVANNAHCKANDSSGLRLMHALSCRGPSSELSSTLGDAHEREDMGRCTFKDTNRLCCCNMPAAQCVDSLPAKYHSCLVDHAGLKARRAAASALGSAPGERLCPAVATQHGCCSCSSGGHSTQLQQYACRPVAHMSAQRQHLCTFQA
jgi:hypothetical protein